MRWHLSLQRQQSTAVTALGRCRWRDNCHVCQLICWYRARWVRKCTLLWWVKWRSSAVQTTASFSLRCMRAVCSERSGTPTFYAARMSNMKKNICTLFAYFILFYFTAYMRTRWNKIKVKILCLLQASVFMRKSCRIFNTNWGNNCYVIGTSTIEALHAATLAASTIRHVQLQHLFYFMLDVWTAVDSAGFTNWRGLDRHGVVYANHR